VIRRTGAALLLATMLAGCTAVPPTGRPGAPPPPAPGAVAVPPQAPPPPPAESFRAPGQQAIAGLEWLYRQDARGLAGAFGTPRLDVAEGDMRKLQYAGGPCVLDVFLYPLSPGDEPVATHVEARRASDGQEVDRRACADALRRR
jgi:hypothetical protein